MCSGCLVLLLWEIKLDNEHEGGLNRVKIKRKSDLVERMQDLRVKMLEFKSLFFTIYFLGILSGPFKLSTLICKIWMI